MCDIPVIVCVGAQLKQKFEQGDHLDFALIWMNVFHIFVFDEEDIQESGLPTSISLKESSRKILPEEMIVHMIQAEAGSSLEEDFYPNPPAGTRATTRCGSRQNSSRSRSQSQTKFHNTRELELNPPSEHDVEEEGLSIAQSAGATYEDEVPPERLHVSRQNSRKIFPDLDYKTGEDN